jgi:Tfp pilus assembly protein PilF
MWIDQISSSAVFTAGQTGASQQEWLQGQVLSQAIDRYTNKDFEGAIKGFTRAIGYAPSSENAVKAYQFMAQAYTNLDDSDNAIKAYKRGLSIDPSNTTINIALGNVYYFNKDFANAEKSYSDAVRYDPSAANRYSLGQAYIATGQLREAEQQFRLVDEMAPNKPQGLHGLGLAAAKRGNYSDAIDFFKGALAVQNDFQESRSELGYALVDAGKIEEASWVRDDLADKNTQLGALLTQYINSKTAAKMHLATSSNFNLNRGPGTTVANLSGYTVHPNEAKTFSIDFYFNKVMDPSEVQNIVNWSISRSSGGAGQSYNFGMHISDTEVTLAPHPIGVYYNPKTQSATVYFNVTQNATGNATIDPGHIKFTFSGKDADGITIDSSANEYTGFSGFA